MKGNKLLVVFAVIVCAVVVIGEMYAYLPNNYGYSSDAEYGSDGISYTLGDRGSSEYDAILLDNGDFEAPSKVYIYFDSGYGSAVNEDVPVEVGAQKMTQEYYIDQLVKVLGYRGVSDVTVMDAAALAATLESDIGSGECSGKALVICAGAIPETVVSIDGTGPIVTWVSQGGSLYWTGNVIGRYVSTQDGVVRADLTSTFVGTSLVNEADTNAYEDASDLRRMFSYEYNRVMYAPDLSAIDRQFLVAGYGDGTYASTTFISMGEGQVCIVAGEYNSKQVRDLAISIASGLCYCSEVLDYDHGTVSGSATGTMAVPSEHGNLRLYLYIGGYFCVYGRGYDFAQSA